MSDRYILIERFQIFTCDIGQLRQLHFGGINPSYTGRKKRYKKIDTYKQKQKDHRNNNTVYTEV